MPHGRAIVGICGSHGVRSHRSRRRHGRAGRARHVRCELPPHLRASAAAVPRRGAGRALERWRVLARSRSHRRAARVTIDRAACGDSSRSRAARHRAADLDRLRNGRWQAARPTREPSHDPASLKILVGRSEPAAPSFSRVWRGRSLDRPERTSWVVRFYCSQSRFHSRRPHSLNTSIPLRRRHRRGGTSCRTASCS